MKKIITIAKNEWLNYFRSGVGFIFSALLLTIAAWVFLSDLFIAQQAETGAYWGVIMFLLSLFVPAISMGLLADEKKNGNWEVILSLPINDEELVLGKFFGSGLYLIFSLLGSWLIMVTIAVLGQPDWGVVAAGFLATVLLGLSYLAIGLLVSAITWQGVVAFLISTVILLLNNLMAQEMVLGGDLKNFSLIWRAGEIAKGVIELSNLVFLMSVIAISLIIAVLVLRGRNK